MKNIYFAFVFIFVLEVSSQNANDDIQNILEQILNKSQLSGSEMTLHPDVGLNISQFLEKYDYPLEYHDVTTDDGYILTLHRIPHGKNAETEQIMANKTKPVMFLVHCLACSSMDYIWQGPNISLAFLLADLGYDVWLANGRGNIHSMRHKTLTPEDKAFWNYSFHDKGMYDLPAFIDYILDYTKLDNITYIGHSQGTAEGFVLTSSRPEYNEKLNLMVVLSPIAYVEHVRSPPAQFLVKYQTVFELLLEIVNVHALPYTPALSQLIITLCNEDSPVQNICIAIIEIIVGFDIPQVDKNTLAVFLTNTPNGVSVKELAHFGQEVKSGYFRQYDYGYLNNMIHYGTAEPPSYNISEITVPIAAYYGKNDYIGGTEDVVKLLSELPNKPVVDHLIEYENFNHLDFVTAKDVKTLLYDKLIEDLQKHIPVF